MADEHGDGPCFERREGLVSVRTQLAVGSSGVGYLESARAKGMTDRELTEDFRKRLRAAGSAAIAYDHPFWAGVSDLERVGSLVELARDEGYRVVTIAEAVRGWL